MPRSLAPALLLLASCTSAPLAIATAPLQENEEIVGHVRGTASGLMLFDLIPVGQNSRFERAYDEAMRSSTGYRLVDIKVRESWYWCVVGNLYVFELTGSCVRRRR